MAADAHSGRDAIRRDAPAKVNLYLHLLKRRPDGYHELDSLVVFADVADRVEAARSDRLGLKLQGPYAASLETMDWGANLAIQAAQALAEISPDTNGAAITLTKNLPVAAGLGGGSTDAAATLRALCELWGLNVTDAELHTVARGLGADVPACLHLEPVYVGGIGDVIEAAPQLPPAWLVLVNPGTPLVTAQVFRSFGRPRSKMARFEQAPDDAYTLATWLGSRSNDLEPVAIGMLPVVSDVLSAVQDTDECLLARMSGSGATCFGLFADEESARSAVSALQSSHAGWWVTSGRILSATHSP